MSTEFDAMLAQVKKVQKVLKLYAHARSARKIGNEIEAEAFERQADAIAEKFCPEQKRGNSPVERVFKKIEGQE